MGALRTFLFTNAAVALSLCLALGSTAVPSATATQLPPVATSSDAVRKVFDPRIVRPLQRSSFEPLRKYFSAKQQKNIDGFLRASDQLIAARDSLAQQLGIRDGWWWPTAVDSFQISSILSHSRDLLTDRSERPKEINISSPSQADGKIEITVREICEEFGQDRYLGVAVKTSRVSLLPDNRRWVIDEIVSTTAHPEGKTITETLTATLEDASNLLRAAEHRIEKLPKTLEVRKGVRADN
jgi:hypothetical protein